MSNVVIGPAGTGALPTYIGTVDPVNDLIPIYDASTAGTVSVYRNQYLNLSSAPVGLTDSQTLTNKTLTSPTISGPTLSGTLTGTYTIGGTPTFPASVTTLTGSQTLTNKTLTSPTINSPTISNATITADTYAGYTTSNSGTIYGMSVTSGVLASAALAGSVNTAAIATNAVTAPKLATNAITLGSVSITGTPNTTSTSYTLITGLTTQVTIPAGGRSIQIDFYTFGIYCSGAAAYVAIYRGATSGSLTTLIQDFVFTSGITMNVFTTLDTPSAGSYYYSVAYKTGNASDAVNISAGSGNSATLLVKAI